MWIVCLIFGALFALGGGIFLGVTTPKFIADFRKNSLEKKDKQYALFAYAALAVGGALLQAAINIANKWSMNALQATASVFGMGFFFLSVGALIVNFFVHYYKINLVKEQATWITRLMFLSIAGAIVSFLILGEGVADFLTYPLPNGIAINGDGFHVTSVNNPHSGGLHITFYGIVIVLGAYVAYLISDHKMYQKFGEHGIFDSTLLIAFPAGIIGARIGYVIGNWNGDTAGGINFSQEVANGNIGSIFAIWNGGLTILGGAIGGILVGALFFYWKHRSIGALTAVDVAVPTILWGQILGRWGNFFNKEVYGAAVPASSMSFLPTWISHQMDAGAGNIYVPLFLVEGLLNIAGYFIIVYAVGKLLKKWLVRGDLGGCYLIWYGVVRLILEPLRDPSFNMGSNGQWSSVWAIIYIVAGFLFIFGLHLFDYFYHVKGNHPRMIPSWHGIKEYEWKRDPVTYTIEDPNLPRTVAHKNKVNSKKVELGEDVPVGESKDEPLPLNDKEE